MTEPKIDPQRAVEVLRAEAAYCELGQPVPVSLRQEIADALKKGAAAIEECARLRLRLEPIVRDNLSLLAIEFARSQLHRPSHEAAMNGDHAAKSNCPGCIATERRDRFWDEMREALKREDTVNPVEPPR